MNLIRIWHINSSCRLVVDNEVEGSLVDSLALATSSTSGSHEKKKKKLIVYRLLVPTWNPLTLVLSSYFSRQVYKTLFVTVNLFLRCLGIVKRDKVIVHMESI